MLERARVLWLGGQSASQVASAFGSSCTRSMIIGHVHRRGWERKGPAKIGCPKTIWTKKMETDLRALVKERLSRPAIADRMGMSYDQIVSKVRKLGLDARDGRQDTAQVIRAGERSSRLRELGKLGAPAAPVSEAPDPNVRGLTILQMPARGACRWPVSGAGADMLMCGCRSYDETYCEDHILRAFAPRVQTAARATRSLERSVRRYAY